MTLRYKIIDTKNNHYLFDPVTTKLVLANGLMLEIMKNYSNEQQIETLRKEHKDFDRYYSYIGDMIKSGMFSHQTEHNVSGEINYLSSPAATLLIVLTGRCNLRCEYCVYNDKYPHEISYSNDDMKMEIATKAINQFFEIYNAKRNNGYFKKPTIMFYGGEPLIKFDLIKEIVSYIEQLGYDCDYYMTTNGLLLNKEYSKFLVMNDFRLTFSLDGYRWNHDRNRVDISGCPTYERVVENIKKYEEIRIAANKDTITSFNCCYDDYTDLEECVKVFTDLGELIKPFFVLYSYISPYDTTYYEWLDKKAKANGWEKCFSDSYYRIKQRFVSGLVESSVEKAAIQSLFSSFYFTDIRSTAKEASPLNKCCVPLTKLAVYPDGTYTICERMNKKLPIGDVYHGLDWQRISQITNLMEKVFSDGNCSKCDFRKMCNVCFQFMDEKGKISPEYCERSKRSIRQQLKEYCELREQYPDIVEKFRPDGESWKIINILA